MFQAHALGHLLLPSFAAERLVTLDAAADRFEFSIGLRLIEALDPVSS